MVIDSVVKQLPSGMRSYPRDTTISIRGLLFSETKKCSRLLNKNDIEELAHLYKDVVKGIDILDLELVDFSLLLILSSTWTVDNFSWNPTILCNNLHNGEVCGGDSLARPVIIDDLDFDESTWCLGSRVPISINNGTEGWAFAPVTVRRKIELEKYLDSLNIDDPEELEDAIDYAKLASLIIPADGSQNPKIEDRIKLIENSNRNEIEDLSKIDSEMLIRINPVVSTCKKCGNEVRIQVDIDNLRRVP